MWWIIDWIFYWHWYYCCFSNFNQPTSAPSNAPTASPSIAPTATPTVARVYGQSCANRRSLTDGGEDGEDIFGQAVLGECGTGKCVSGTCGCNLNSPFDNYCPSGTPMCNNNVCVAVVSDRPFFVWIIDLQFSSFDCLLDYCLILFCY